MKRKEFAFLVRFAQLLTHNLGRIHDKINQILAEYALHRGVAKGADYLFCDAVRARVQNGAVGEEEAGFAEGRAFRTMVRVKTANSGLPDGKI